LGKEGGEEGLESPEVLLGERHQGAHKRKGDWPSLNSPSLPARHDVRKEEKGFAEGEKDGAVRYLVIKGKRKGRKAGKKRGKRKPSFLSSTTMPRSGERGREGTFQKERGGGGKGEGGMLLLLFLFTIPSRRTLRPKRERKLERQGERGGRGKTALSVLIFSLTCGTSSEKREKEAPVTLTHVEGRKRGGLYEGKKEKGRKGKTRSSFFH